MAKLIKLDGTVETITPQGATFSLEELYKALECEMVQMIPLGARKTAWMDEEGKLKPHEKNELAQALYGDLLLPGDYFAGRVLICDWSEVD